MIYRRNLDNASFLFLLILTLGFLFMICNLVVFVFHDRITSQKNVVGNLSVMNDDPIMDRLEEPKSLVEPLRPFHVAVTSSNDLYCQWQSRVMYYWYKKMTDVGAPEMGGFTRILHAWKPDNLMNEIPTFVADPLPVGMDRGYIVLNRPWALVQWLEKVHIEEEYVLMAEPDHIFLKPLPNLSSDDMPAAFQFDYIKPLKYENILRKYYPEDKGPITNVYAIGNSPVIIRKSQLKEIAPTWMNVSVKMKYDPVTDKSFGWVLEMYGYSVSSALHGIQHIFPKNFMVQPPKDKEVGNACILHYTYPCDASLKGHLTGEDSLKTGKWQFNKRFYYSRPPPRNFSLPPPEFPESVVTLVEKLNEASANIPDWDLLEIA